MADHSIAAAAQPRSAQHQPIARTATAAATGSPRAATEQVQRAEHLVIDLPVVGTVELPRPEHLAYYGAVAALAALEIIEWPVAVALAAGHALIHQQHSRSLRELGEALEEV